LIIQRVAELRLPAIYQFPEVAGEGGFLGYGPRVTQLYKEQVASMLIKLLRGAKPSDLPVEQPTKFELVVNLKTANALAVTVPEPFPARAGKVIE
jgi:putative tryptophan/tyrosine transport system substrate-binding protein